MILQIEEECYTYVWIIQIWQNAQQLQITVA